MSERLRAATLAVGTEVVDGQITDRNSAWISDRCVAAGVDVIEHRAVPDERSMIAHALRELSDRVDLLFVTGGLGPTSDDFTRDLIAEVYERPLEYDEASWQKIVKRFEARGAQAKPIQKQQCFFPRGASILANPMGTANAFSLSIQWQGRALFVVVLPGPPAEIAAVWEAHLSARIDALVPESRREDLHLWQTLGLGEGDIAEKVEEAVRDSGLRVGYRVHIPYVEVKLWAPRARDSRPVLERLDQALASWTVARGKQDLVMPLVHACFSGTHLVVRDAITSGYLETRLIEALAQFRKQNPERAAKGSLQVITELLSPAVPATGEQFDVGSGGPEHALVLSLKPDHQNRQWIVTLTGASVQKSAQTLAVQPTPLYNFGSERGNKYLAEKLFHALSTLAPFA